jgi:hypothetical protein
VILFSVEIIKLERKILSLHVLALSMSDHASLASDFFDTELRPLNIIATRKAVGDCMGSLIGILLYLQLFFDLPLFSVVRPENILYAV